MAIYEGRVPGPIMEESRAINPTVRGSSVSVGAMLLDTVKGSATGAKKVTGFGDFSNKFGGYKLGSYAAYEVDTFFKEGGRELYVGRVIKSDATTAGVTLVDAQAENTLTVNGDSPGAWASSGSTALSVHIDTDYQHPANPPNDFTAPGPVAGATSAIISSRMGLRIGSIVKFYDSFGGTKTEYRVLTGVSSAFVTSTLTHTITWYEPLLYAYPNATGSLTSMEFKILVYENGTLVEEWGNLTMLDTDSRYCETIVNDDTTGSLYIRVADHDAEVRATGTITLKATPNLVTDTETIIIPAGAAAAGITFTFQTPAVTLTNGVLIGADNAATATNLIAAINASTTAQRYVTASSGGVGIVTLTAVPGYGSIANLPVAGSAQPGHATVTAMTGGKSGLGQDLPAATGAGLYHNLSGGSDGTIALVDADFIGVQPTKTGFYKFDPYRINMLAAPGQASAPVIAAGICYCENRADCVFVGDAPAANTVASLTTFRNTTLGADSSFGFLTCDRIQVFDPIGVGTSPRIYIPMSGQWMGIRARVEQLPPPDGGPWRSAAGTGDFGKIKTALGLETGFSDNEIGELNALGYICPRRLDKYGICVWGARNLSTDPNWRYQTTRFTFLYAERAVMDAALPLTFLNNEIQQNRLGNMLVNSISQFLMQMWQAGGLVGSSPAEAFYVISDSTNNAQSDINVGTRITEIGLADQKPGEFLVFRFGQIVPGSMTLEEV